MSLKVESTVNFEIAKPPKLQIPMGTSARPNIHFFTPETVKRAPKKRKKLSSRHTDKPKERYRLTNWPDYNRALIQRGRLQLWLDEQTLQNWYYSGQRHRGGPPMRGSLSL